MKNIFGEIGYTQSYDSFSREPIRELRGLDGVKTYREMHLNSAVIGSALLAVKMLIRGSAWLVEADPADDPRARLVEDCMDDMSHSWNDHISQALTMLPFGWAWFEVVYKKRSDGRIGWKKFAFRSQDTMHPTTPWEFDDNGSLRAFRQWMTTTATRNITSYDICIPIEKSILYRTQTDDEDPEGRSVLRSAYLPYHYARNLQEIEAIGLERNLVGLPKLQETGEAASDLSEGSPLREQAKAMLRRIRVDEEAGVLVPHGFEFELMGISGGGDGSKNIRSTIESYEHRMTLVMLAGFLLLGSTDTGSYALSKMLGDLFYTSLNAWADIISDTLNRHVVPKLLLLNGLPIANPPRITHEPIDVADSVGVADYFQKLAGARLVEWDAELERWLRGIVDAPTLTDEQIIAREAATPMAPVQQQATGSYELLSDYYKLSQNQIEDAAEDQRARAERRLKRFYAQQRREVLGALGDES